MSLHVVVAGHDATVWSQMIAIAVSEAKVVAQSISLQGTGVKYRTSRASQHVPIRAATGSLATSGRSSEESASSSEESASKLATKV